jgi:cellulose synthase/poly-beta-1,6-N-acetylglucosamine synthase-like glycosyltransferase
MRTKKGKMGIKIDVNFRPTVSLIVATYNEAVVIGKKLENIQKMDYPEDKLRVIIVDSASNDGTLEVCKDFLSKNRFRFPIQLISEKERSGKSHALNFALKHADGEIIATSDADSFWEQNALGKAVAYFADPSVGAVTGEERIGNVNKSLHTMSEGIYRQFYYTLRLGESHIHSTLIFQGELALYRRSAFNEFEERPGYSDDIGTVLNIVSDGYRCIFVPEAIFSDAAPFSLEGRLNLKSRRAKHLISGLLRSIKLKIKRKLPISFKVIFFNFFLQIISPILFFLALCVTVLTYVFYVTSFWFLIFLLIPFFFRKPRVFASSYLTSNVALIMGLLPVLTNRRSKIWNKVDEMREKT